MSVISPSWRAIAGRPVASATGPARHQPVWMPFVTDAAAAASVAGAVGLVAWHSWAMASFGLVLVAVWLFALGVAGGYRPGSGRLTSPTSPVLGALGWSASVAALPALLASDGVQRLVVLQIGGSAIGAAAARGLRSSFVRRRPPMRVVLFGSAEQVRTVEAKLDARRGRARLQVAHTRIATGAGLIPTARRAPGTSPYTPLLADLVEHEADVVLLCGDAGLSSEETRRLVWDLADRNVELLVSTDTFGAHRSRALPVDIDGVHALAITRPQLTGPAKAVKSAVERTLAAVGVLVLSPLLAVIAVAIKCTSPGPALFRQARTGLDGVNFVVFKFRTMRQGSAEQFLALAREAGQNSMFFKLESDPRITRFGSFLRKTSLDELPQLFNVVLGSMSLVGPRPLPAEVEQTGGDVARRLRALPGITGQWQVSGRSSVKGAQAVEHDIDYVDNWRLGLDLSILRRTVRAVLRSDGAY